MHFTTQRRWTGSLFFTLCLWFLSATPAQAQVCDFEKRCGTACCQQGEVCYLGACIQEGTSCTENQDCASKEFCEATLKRCFPLSQTNLTCEYKPPVGKFAPKIAWEWRGGQIQPLSKNVMMTPVVMALQDTNNDNKIDAKDVPTVIFMSFEKGFTYADPGHLRAVRGDNGKPIFTNTTNTVNALGSLAVGDINNDGKPEIVAPRFSGTSGDPAGGMFAFKNDGTLLWTAKDQAGKIVPVRSGWGGASLADLDADGNPEVVVGSTVIRGSDGLVLCQGNKGNGSLANGAITSIVADLDNDGDQDLVGIIRHGVETGHGGQFNVAGDGCLTMDELGALLGKPVLKLPLPLIKAGLIIGHRLGLSRYAPEQIKFIQFRPVLDNQRLKDAFGYVPAKSSREAFLHRRDHQRAER